MTNAIYKFLGSDEIVRLHVGNVGRTAIMYQPNCADFVTQT